MQCEIANWNLEAPVLQILESSLLCPQDRTTIRKAIGEDLWNDDISYREGFQNILVSKHRVRNMPCCFSDRPNLTGVFCLTYFLVEASLSSPRLKNPQRSYHGIYRSLRPTKLRFRILPGRRPSSIVTSFLPATLQHVRSACRDVGMNWTYPKLSVSPAMFHCSAMKTLKSLNPTLTILWRFWRPLNVEVASQIWDCKYDFRIP